MFFCYVTTKGRNYLINTTIPPAAPPNTRPKSGTGDGPTRKRRKEVDLEESFPDTETRRGPLQFSRGGRSGLKGPVTDSPKGPPPVHLSADHVFLCLPGLGE